MVRESHQKNPFPEGEVFVWRRTISREPFPRTHSLKVVESDSCFFPDNYYSVNNEKMNRAFSYPELSASIIPAHDDL
jgi:hypothetical protein